MNDLLDKVAMGNVEHKKADTRNALQVLLRNTSALEQVNNYSHIRLSMKLRPGLNLP